MRFASVCSGIEAASVAWHPLGWEAAWLSEIDPFPCAILSHHYPTTPNLGDMTKISEADLERHGDIDLLVGGTPCQSFSVAGLRKGLADPRGGLALVFLELARRTRARWVVWENVPGVLSADRGRAFGSFLGGLAELGYGFAYRVLDAQYFGLAQRRKRVFVVGHLGDWRRAAAVLLERASLRGDPAPSREAGARVAGCLDGGAHGGGFDDNDARAGKCVEVVHLAGDQANAEIGENVGCTLNCDKGQRGGIVTHSLRADGFDASEDGTGRGTPLVPVAYRKSRRAADANDDETWVNDGVANTLNNFDLGDVRTTHAVVSVAAPLTAGGHPNSNAPGRRKEDDTNLAVQAFNWQSGGDGRGLDPRDTAQLQRCQTPATQTATGVRRLTPRECCRLQGFPDDYLDIPYRGKPASDGPKYKALGNSMAVPVMRWIGERIAEVEATMAAQGDDATRARGGKS